MNCPNCDRKMNRKWSYCPYCGNNLKTNIFDNINKMINNVFEGFFNKPSGKNNKFTIRIKSPSGRVITNKPRKKKIIKRKKRMIKMPKKMVEPEVKVKRHGNELEIIIEVPGVKSGRDVSITRLEESIEIRAIAGDKGYFKIISVPKDFRLISKKLNDNVLSVRMKQ